MKTLKPDELVLEPGGFHVDPVANIAGSHLSCVNQAETTESWRQPSTEDLE